MTGVASDMVAQSGAKNSQLAVRLMEVFGQDMDFWWRNADESLSLFFPYAPSIGMPDYVEGLDSSREYLLNVVKQVAGLKFFNIRATPAENGDTVFLEYQGNCPAPNGTYDQKYITIMRFRAGKLISFTEYWDTTEVTRAYGNLGQEF